MKIIFDVWWESMLNITTGIDVIFLWIGIHLQVGQSKRNHLNRQMLSLFRNWMNYSIGMNGRLRLKRIPFPSASPLVMYREKNFCVDWFKLKRSFLQFSLNSAQKNADWVSSFPFDGRRMSQFWPRYNFEETHPFITSHIFQKKTCFSELSPGLMLRHCLFSTWRGFWRWTGTDYTRLTSGYGSGIMAT